jgi:hypothetical protein
MEYFVSPDGKDDDDGTFENPFQTLARAAAALQPGDSCILRSGVYRETLRPERSGAPGRPITYRAFSGETPILSAGDSLHDWRREEDGRWSALMPIDLEDGNQIFADGRMLTEARWPKNSGDLFQPARAIASAGSPTTLTDPSLSGDPDSWTDALLWCLGGHKWICWAGPVTSFDPAFHTLSFTSKMAATHWYTPVEKSEYVLMGVKAALDQPGEWWFDRTTGRLWIIPPDDCSPESLAIEARARRIAIDLSGLRHIHLHGLHFRGAGLCTDDASRHLRLEELHGEYVAHSYLRDASDESIVIAGADHVIRGCDFGYSSGSVVQLRGRHHKLLGNHIHHGNYGGLWKGTLSLAGRRHVVAHNSVHHSGRDLLSVHGLMESLVEHNDLSHAGWLAHDLGITYGHDTDFSGTLIRRNHVHDCVAKGLAEGIYFDHCSHNAIVYENLIWNIPAMPIQVNNPGHFNLIAHNSCYQTNTGRPEITSFDHSHRQDLFGCHFVNNLVNGPFSLPENAAVEGNLVSPDPGYANADTADFSLRPDSPAVGAAKPIPGIDGGGPDLGAVPQDRVVWPAGCNSSIPIDESVEWERPNWTYTNRLINAAFEFGSAEGWQTVGAAKIVDGNGWGNKVAGTEEVPTGTSRHELQLTGPAALEQVVAELPANTRFQLSAWVKSISGARVTLALIADGQSPVRAESSDPQWTRLIVGFQTGPDPTSALVVVRQETDDRDARTRIDNIGLVEAA